MKVLVTMGRMEKRLFKKHLPLFYPYFTKLICSDQVCILCPHHRAYAQPGSGMVRI